MRLTKEQRKAQILEIATELFVAKGYHQTKTKDIAQACGITEPVIYKHFDSKDELFLEAIVNIAGETFQEISFDRETDTEVVLSSFVMNRVQKVEDHFSLFKRLLVELLENEKIRGYYFNKFLPRLANPIINYVDLLKEQGYLKDKVPSKVIALSLAGILLMVSMAKYLEDESAFSEISPQELAGQMLSISLHGLLNKEY
ncbi:MAG: TetR/AcrR family transcriptional regulator [Clostridia bacterium]|nr:TetR/AcrR family transcriptional regulator [Clostridia bacterium]MDD4146112.1 TetR/AcrR family transcriptional regulator [Clostridia bacterium]MDD4666339.1 TetR/AcrR family transcriptional regulator [Clostridia bacterium]